MTQDNEWTDWLEHDGGVCPVHTEELILVRLDDGTETKKPERASNFFWWRANPQYEYGDEYRVTHYKRKKNAVEAEKKVTKKIKTTALPEIYLYEINGIATDTIFDEHSGMNTQVAFNCPEKVEYIRKDIHDRRVTELLESSNQSLERARKAEKMLKDLLAFKEAKSNGEFYIRNIERGFLGNSPQFWAKGGAGYTVYLEKAERFSRSDADEVIKKSPEKFEKFPCHLIDMYSQSVFDWQNIRRAMKAIRD